MKRMIVFFVMVSCSVHFPVIADNDTLPGEEQGFSVSFRGFVKTDYWIDSRTVVAAREDLFLLYPAGKKLDDNGVDIYGDPVFNFSAITSRVAGHFTGPDAFGARVSGMIEADFSGVTDADINGFRLRHAYLNLSWERWDLLLGQWWHPLFSPAVVPAVVSLNTGAPFQPFIRNPQASLTYHHANSSWLLSFIGQRDNSSDGPQGVSPNYLRTAVMPNVHFQWSRKAGNVSKGLAADYKTIRPRLVTESNLYTDNNISTFALMAYGRVTGSNWDVKAKTIYGQNLSEHLMLGGYAETRIDDEGFVSYTPLNHLSSWANVLYGDRVMAGIFLGYAHNFGADEQIAGESYGRGEEIAYVYRLAPSLRFSSGNIELCAELEYTAAAYGEPDNKGRVKHHEEVANTRLLFTAFYYF